MVLHIVGHGTTSWHRTILVPAWLSNLLFCGFHQHLLLGNRPLLDHVFGLGCSYRWVMTTSWRRWTGFLPVGMTWASSRRGLTGCIFISVASYWAFALILMRSTFWRIRTALPRRLSGLLPILTSWSSYRRSRRPMGFLPSLIEPGGRPYVFFFGFSNPSGDTSRAIGPNKFPRVWNRHVLQIHLACRSSICPKAQQILPLHHDTPILRHSWCGLYGWSWLGLSVSRDQGFSRVLSAEVGINPIFREA